MHTCTHPSIHTISCFTVIILMIGIEKDFYIIKATLRALSSGKYTYFQEQKTWKRPFTVSKV